MFFHLPVDIEAMSGYKVNQAFILKGLNMSQCLRIQPKGLSARAVDEAPPICKKTHKKDVQHPLWYSFSVWVIPLPDKRCEISASLCATTKEGLPDLVALTGEL